MTDSVEKTVLPQHVAIVMDGNGRWAEQRGQPRHQGHRAGVDSVRSAVDLCGEKGIKVLTLFAFSSENWRRPRVEVNLLLDLFAITLQRETEKLHENNIRLRIIGNIAAFPEKLRQRIHKAEQHTRHNTALILQIAANYGGRWDMAQAARHLATQCQTGHLTVDQIDEQQMAQATSFGADIPDPDLLIRTGGEQRISNFLLWHSAYAELYFTDTLWPDFDEQAFESALTDYSRRQRRFGKTSEQLSCS